MRGAAEKFGAKTPALDALIDAYQQAVLSPATIVYGAGPAQADKKDPFSNLIGFHLVGVEGDAGRYEALVEQAVKVVNDPKLRKVAEQELDESLRHLPQLKKISARDLPKGASGYEFRLSARDLDKLAPNGAAELKASLGKEPLVVQLWVVHQEQRTWFALGDETARERLKQVLAGDNAQSLASRPGLEQLRSESASSGGFLTLAGYAHSVEAMSQTQSSPTISTRDVLLAMPAHGQTPILYGSHALAVGPSFKFSARVPKAALQDLTAAVVSIAAQGGAF
jgi:hypothetical protein